MFLKGVNTVENYPVYSCLLCISTGIIGQSSLIIHAKKDLHHMNNVETKYIPNAELIKKFVLGKKKLFEYLNCF